MQSAMYEWYVRNHWFLQKYALPFIGSFLQLNHTTYRSHNKISPPINSMNEQLIRLIVRSRRNLNRLIIQWWWFNGRELIECILQLLITMKKNIFHFKDFLNIKLDYIRKVYRYELLLNLIEHLMRHHKKKLHRWCVN